MLFSKGGGAKRHPLFFSPKKKTKSTKLIRRYIPFTILTRTPSDDIAMIHDRMPVILPREAAADWLNPRYHGEEILSAALTNMKYHELKGAAKRDTLDGYPI